MESEKWKLSWADIDKWTKNATLFFSPVVVLYLLFVISNINQDGFSWSDFNLNDVVVGGMMLYILNTLLDLFRKLSSGPEQA